MKRLVVVLLLVMGSGLWAEDPDHDAQKARAKGRPVLKGMDSLGSEKAVKKRFSPMSMDEISTEKPEDEVEKSAEPPSEESVPNSAHPQ